MSRGGHASRVQAELMSDAPPSTPAILPAGTLTSIRSSLAGQEWLVAAPAEHPDGGEVRRGSLLDGKLMRQSAKDVQAARRAAVAAAAAAAHDSGAGGSGASASTVALLGGAGAGDAGWGAEEEEEEEEAKSADQGHDSSGSAWHSSGPNARVSHAEDDDAVPTLSAVTDGQAVEAADHPERDITAPRLGVAEGGEGARVRVGASSVTEADLAEAEEDDEDAAAAAFWAGGSGLGTARSGASGFFAGEGGQPQSARARGGAGATAGAGGSGAGGEWGGAGGGTAGAGGAGSHTLYLSGAARRPARQAGGSAAASGASTYGRVDASQLTFFGPEGELARPAPPAEGLGAGASSSRRGTAGFAAGRRASGARHHESGSAGSGSAGSGSARLDGSRSVTDGGGAPARSEGRDDSGGNAAQGGDAPPGGGSGTEGDARPASGGDAAAARGAETARGGRAAAEHASPGEAAGWGGMELVTDGDADAIAARLWGQGTPRTPRRADANAGSRGLTPAMLSDPRVMGALRLAQREGVSMDVAMRLLAAASADAEDSAASPAQGAGGRGPSSAAATASVTPGGPAPEPHADLAGAGPTRRRSPSVQAIVPVRHGRRVKVVTVRAEELWALPSVRGRLAALGVLAVAARQARRRSVAAKLLGLGMAARVCRQSREARVAAKLLAVGLAAGSRRRRVVGSLSARLFAVGLPLLQQRWDAAERAAAAEAAERKAQKQAAKLAKAESAKVRQVRWGVLTEADVAEGSMWARQSGEGEAAQESGQAAASEVDDLMGRVKLAFAKVAPAQGRGGGGADSKPAKARAAKPTKVSLIADAKTQRALGIGIAGAVRGTTLDELSKGIAQLDADALGGLDAAEALLGMMEEVPPEAEAAVRSFQGDPSTLDLPEQFILRCVVEVPRAKERLALATAQASLSDSMRIVRQRAELVEKACAEVRGSWRFRFLLRDVVVPIGNQLNAGTKLGQAAGVRIDTLSSLVQTRAADNRTFLRFIVEGLVESDDGADLLHVVDDFPTITGTAPAFFAWDALTSETAALRKGSALASKVLVIPE